MHYYQDVPAHYPWTSASVCFLPHQQILIVDLEKIESFDTNDVFIRKYEIGISDTYEEDSWKKLMK